MLDAGSELQREGEDGGERTDRLEERWNLDIGQRE